MIRSPTRGLRDDRELNDAARKTKISQDAYEQLKRDLEREHWEQKRRRKDEEKKEKDQKKQEPLRGERKATTERSWERLQAEVKKYDDGLIVGYKEDIDTLLVFAGLFSAVVTAFLIESYQWLSEDTTVVILTQISHTLNGVHNQSESVPFTPEASSIRINCLWFLSLIFSLTSALFGLLCKQWLREHQRDIPTRTPGEDLALRQLRRDSFEKWGVTSFLSALPILLEVALISFFVSVLDLLWTLHRIPFHICLAAISLSVGLYLLTTVLPTITAPRDQASFIQRQEFSQLEYQFICPYKSPQAWAVYKLLITLPRLILTIPFIGNFTKRHLRPLWGDVQPQISSWSTFDLWVVRQFDQKVQAPYTDFRLKVYELQALRWAVTMFRDSPSIIPHLRNVLETLPPSVVISAVLDRWDIAMWEVSERDIGPYFHLPNIRGGRPKPVTSDAPLQSGEGIELLFRCRLWDVCVEWLQAFSAPYYSKGLFRHFEQEMSGASSKNLRFSIPLPLATALWSHKNPWIRQQSLRLLGHFEESWKSPDSPAYDYSEEGHNKERLAFAQAIAWHINRSDQPSELLRSKRGQEFIRFIHNEIIVRRLYSQYGFYERMWRNAISKVREVGKLPLDYFMDLPYPNKNPPPSTEPPRLGLIRYSIDTVRADEESPPLAVVESIDIQVQVCGSRGSATREIANLADNALVSSSAKRGSGIQGYTLPLESVAEGTNVAPLSAGEDEQNGAVPQDTGQDRPMSAQAIVGVAPAFSTTPHISDTTVAGSTPSGTEHISSGSQVFESAGERVPRIEEDGLGSVHTVRTSASGYQANHAEELQDEGRVGWNPTNDPNLLRVYWLRP